MAADILENVDADSDVIAVDEVQFFDEQITEVCEKIYPLLKS